MSDDLLPDLVPDEVMREPATGELSPAAQAFLKAAEAVVGPQRYSATFTGAVDKCPLSAQLNRDFGTVGEPATTGTAFHDVMATLAFIARKDMRETFESDEAVKVAEWVLAHPQAEDDILDTNQIDDVLGMVSGFVPRFPFPIWDDVYEIEQLVVHELEGRALSAKMDLFSASGTHARIIDYKTGANIPTDKDMREDPKTRAALNTYAWHALMKLPGLLSVSLELVFPRKNIIRKTTIFRDEILRTERALRIKVARIQELYRQGLEAKGGQHCFMCARPDLCPLPDRINGHTTVNSYLEAQLAVEEYFAGAALLKQHQGEIRRYIDEHELQYVALENGSALGYFGGGDTVQINRRLVEKAGLLDIVGEKKQSKPSFTTRANVKS